MTNYSVLKQRSGKWSTQILFWNPQQSNFLPLRKSLHLTAFQLPFPVRPSQLCLASFFVCSLAEAYRVFELLRRKAFQKHQVLPQPLAMRYLYVVARIVRRTILGSTRMTTSSAFHEVLPLARQQGRVVLFAVSPNQCQKSGSTAGRRLCAAKINIIIFRQSNSGKSLLCSVELRLFHQP